MSSAQLDKHAAHGKKYDHALAEVAQMNGRSTVGGMYCAA